MKRRPSTTDLLALLWLLVPSLAWAGPNTLAVFYFESSGNEELAPLKVGLAQMLITDLSDVDDVKVVERTELQKILDELDLGHSGIADPSTAAQAGKLLGAEWMLLGSYMELAGTFMVTARLVRVETSEILHPVREQGKVEDFMAIERKIAAFYEQKLPELAAASPSDGAPPPPKTRGDDDGSGDAGTPPPTDETAVVAPDADELGAAVAFSEGLIYLDKKDVARARESFEQAVEKNPDLDEAKSQLASLDL